MQKKPSNRRDFLGKIAASAAAVGIASITSPFSVNASPEFFDHTNDADEWFSKIKGKHRIMYDVVRPNGMLPFAWSRIFLVTNTATGTPEKDNNVVVVLRHDGIPYAMQDNLWAKYKFGEMFKVTDDKTKAAALRNPFWKPAPGDYKAPGIGNVAVGINELQDSGVMFCACNMALTVYSAVIAQQTNQDAAVVKNEFLANILPGIQVVPSGVWAVNRAQEHGCSYCYAG
ncbi:MAG: twin-arginine translocation signal domain-containing protein [Chitinophagaceae bacterium]|nr:twin-arginine translocation signal domain-containing protein [Chitinophagaceae bacterium]